MKLPRRVRIKSRWWRVHLVPDDHPELAEPEGPPCLGSCNIKTYEIYVNRDQEPESLRDTFAHELAHACYRGSPGLPDTEDGEESIVCFATEYFFEVLRNVKFEWTD